MAARVGPPHGANNPGAMDTAFRSGKQMLARDARHSLTGKIASAVQSLAWRVGLQVISDRRLEVGRAPGPRPVCPKRQTHYKRGQGEHDEQCKRRDSGGGCRKSMNHSCLHLFKKPAGKNQFLPAGEVSERRYGGLRRCDRSWATALHRMKQRDRPRAHSICRSRLEQRTGDRCSVSCG
jgi:hypothetical protein